MAEENVPFHAGGLHPLRLAKDVLRLAMVHYRLHSVERGMLPNLLVEFNHEENIRFLANLRSGEGSIE